MAAFHYIGKALVNWGNGHADSVHDIMYIADKHELTVSALPSARLSAPHPLAAWIDYRGPIENYSAVHIVFLHQS